MTGIMETARQCLSLCLMSSDLNAGLKLTMNKYENLNNKCASLANVVVV